MTQGSYCSEMDNTLGPVVLVPRDSFHLSSIICYLSSASLLYLRMEFKRLSLSPLNHREFRIYIFVRFFYIMALRMVGTVVAYKLFHLTKSSFSIGIVGLSEFIP